ncbi:sugar phosphate isomerase/epimerase family protein [Enterococcus faecalis]|uniref:sugar phosphate isomerase/epimerase family protein n=1 Tax=Enterococcus faecalis TaxID=1351 RepID=UPI0034E48275
MKVSINTAVFLAEMQAGSKQSDCLEKLIGKPIDNIEIRGEFLTKDAHGELKLIAALCDENHWGLYFSIPEELFSAGELNEAIFSYLKMAKENKVKGLKIGLGSFSELSAQAVVKLRKALQVSEVKVTVENQPNENGVLETFSKNLSTVLNEIPELGFTFDSGNWYWVEEKPEEAFQQLKKDITLFHLKDIKKLDTVMLGEGETNWEKLVFELENKVPVFLEYAIDEHLLDQEINKVNSKLKKCLHF